MNKKIFFKLWVVLLSLSLIACGQKNNLDGEEDSSKSNSSNSVSTIENSEDNNHEDVNQDTQEESAEDEYYIIIKKAWQKQKDYIESIDDPKVKQSVQTSRSAAIMEADRLLIEHPEDSNAINSSLKSVLSDE